MKKFTTSTKFVVVSILALVMLAVAVGAAELSDIQGHWAKENIEYGVQGGYLNGYPDGTFLPDKTVTRAEFSKMINSAVKITSTDAESSFSDLVAGEWYIPEVKKAVYAGYINGYEDGTFRPHREITRQEAAVILSRIVIPTVERKDINTFDDGRNIDTWATDAVSMIAAKGYIRGDEYNNFRPSGNLTRAEAATLICNFIKSEGKQIVNVNKTAVPTSGKEIIFTETLFTEDVTIELADGADYDIIFKNCRVLGDVQVNTLNADIELENSSFKVLDINQEGAKVSFDRSSVIKTAEVGNIATLDGDGIQKVIISGRDLSGDTIRLGNCEVVEVNSDAALSTGVIGEMNLNRKVNLVLMSGTINEFNVISVAAGSTINLASSKVDIEKANNKAAVSYFGTGTIEIANNEVKGVKYDDALTIDIKTGVTDTATPDDNSGNTSSGFFADVVVTPARGKTNVAVTSAITLKFDEKIYNASGKTLTSDYIESNFEFNRGTASGYRTGFEAVVSGSKSIVIEPLADLRANTKYYVVIPAGILTYEDGTQNEEFTTYFTTAADEEDEDDDDSVVEVEFDPAQGKTLDVNDDIIITFDEVVYSSKNRTTLTDYYCENTAFQLREKSSSGTIIGVTATVSKNGKTVTLSPAKTLSAKTTYYILLVKNSLYDYSGNALSAKTSYFTTTGGFTVDVSPKTNSTNISKTPDITLEIGEAVLDKEYQTITAAYIKDNVQLKNQQSQGVEFNVSMTTGARTITITPKNPLMASHRYTLVVPAGIFYGETSKTFNEQVTSYFTTAAANIPDITPMNGKINVDANTSIVVDFGSAMYKTVGTSKQEIIDAKYIEDQKAIVLRRNNASGSIVNCTITVTDGKTVTLTPDTALSTKYTYMVQILAGKFRYGTNGTTNVAATSTFTTRGTLTPDVTVKVGSDTVKLDGEDEIALNTNIYVTFDEAVYVEGTLGKVTSTYLNDSVIKLYPKNNPSKKVSVEPSLSSDYKTITIDPVANLESDTDYVLEIAYGKLTDTTGFLKNPAKTVNFRTKLVVDTTVALKQTITTGVRLDFVPVIKFASAIIMPNKETLDASNANHVNYVQENIRFYKGYANNVNNQEQVEITWNSECTEFTIKPKKLEFKTTYYLVISGYASTSSATTGFLYSDEKTAVTAKTFTITTLQTNPEVTKTEIPANLIKETEATINVTANCAGTIYASIDGGNTFPYSVASYANGVRQLVLNNLKQNTSYNNIIVYVVDAAGNESTKVVAGSITTKKAEPKVISAQVDNIQHDRVTVRYNVSCDGNLYVTHSGTTVATACTEGVGEFVVTGLSPKTKYKFTVKLNDGTKDSVVYNIPEFETKEIPVPVVTASKGAVDEFSASVAYTVSVAGSTVYYKVDGGAQETANGGTITLTGLTPDTEYALEIWAVSADNLTSEKVEVTVKTIKLEPVITVQTTVTGDSATVVYMLEKWTGAVCYSVDGGEKQTTTTPYISLANLQAGDHSIKLWIEDSQQNVLCEVTDEFTVEAPQPQA